MNELHKVIDKLITLDEKKISEEKKHIRNFYSYFKHPEISSDTRYEYIKKSYLINYFKQKILQKEIDIKSKLKMARINEENLKQYQKQKEINKNSAAFFISSILLYALFFLTTLFYLYTFDNTYSLIFYPHIAFLLIIFITGVFYCKSNKKMQLLRKCMIKNIETIYTKEQYKKDVAKTTVSLVMFLKNIKLKNDDDHQQRYEKERLTTEIINHTYDFEKDMKEDVFIGLKEMIMNYLVYLEKEKQEALLLKEFDENILDNLSVDAKLEYLKNLQKK